MQHNFLAKTIAILLKNVSEETHLQAKSLSLSFRKQKQRWHVLLHKLSYECKLNVFGIFVFI